MSNSNVPATELKLGTVILGKHRLMWGGRVIVRTPNERARTRINAKNFRTGDSREKYLKYRRAYYAANRDRINAGRRTRYARATA